MKRNRLFHRLVSGSLENVAFLDMMGVAQGFGFALVRIKGSHRILRHPDIPALVNLQDVGGQRKPYQIRQFLRIVERYNPELEA